MVKRFFFIVLVCFIVFNIIASSVITFSTIFNGKYFNEYDNIKSLKNKELYMEILPFSMVRTYHHGDGNGVNTFEIEGYVNNKELIILTIGKNSYVDFNIDNYMVYKSILTGDYFLKGASEKYYDSLMTSFIFGIYLKISFYILIILSIIFYFKIKKS